MNFDPYSAAERQGILKILQEAAAKKHRHLEADHEGVLWNWLTDCASAYPGLAALYKRTPPSRRANLARLKRLLHDFNRHSGTERGKLVQELDQPLFLSILSWFERPLQLAEAHLLKVGDEVRSRSQRVPEQILWFEPGVMAHLVAFRLDVSMAFRAAMSQAIEDWEQRISKKPQRPGTRRNEPIRWFAGRLAEIWERAVGKPPGYSTLDPENPERRRPGGRFFRLVKACVLPLHAPDRPPSDAAINTVIRTIHAQRQHSAK